MKESDWQLLGPYFLWFVFPFMVISYMVMRYSVNIATFFCHYFSGIAVASKCFKIYIQFRMFCKTLITEKPSFNRNEKVVCEKSGTQTTKLNLVLHKKSCSARFLTCTSCTNFSTKIRGEMSHHIAKKHSETAARVVHECKISDKDFHGFHIFTFCENISRRNMEPTEVQVLKTLMLHN